MASVRIVPWWQRIPAILAYPFTSAGVMALAFLTFVDFFALLASFGPFKLVSMVFTTGFTFAVLFLVIRRCSEGNEKFPSMGDIEDVFDDIVAPGMKVIALTVVLYGPSLFCGVKGGLAALKGMEKGLSAVADRVTTSPTETGEDRPIPFGGGPFPGGKPPGFFPGMAPPDEVLEAMERGGAMEAEAPPMPMPTPPKILTPEVKDVGKTLLIAGGWFFLAGVFALVSSLLYPLAMILLAVSGSLLSAIFPGAWISVLGRVFLSYVGLLVGLFVLSAIYGIARIPLTLMAVAIPFAPLIVLSGVKTYLSICAAQMLGWFVWQNRDRLGIQVTERRDVTVEEMRAMASAAARARGAPPAVARRTASAPAANGGAARTEAGASNAPGGPAIGSSAGFGSPRAMPAIAKTAAPAASPPAAVPTPEAMTQLQEAFTRAWGAGNLAAAQTTAAPFVDGLWALGRREMLPPLYRALQRLSPDASLDPDRQARLAADLESAGEVELALGAWRAMAFVHPGDPRSPDALQRCVDLCVRAGHPDWAESAAKLLHQRYPGRAKGGTAAPAGGSPAGGTPASDDPLAALVASGALVHPDTVDLTLDPGSSVDVYGSLGADGAAATAAAALPASAAFGDPASFPLGPRTAPSRIASAAASSVSSALPAAAAFSPTPAPALASSPTAGAKLSTVRTAAAIAEVGNKRMVNPEIKAVVFQAEQGTTLKKLVPRAAAVAAVLYGILWLKAVFADGSFRDRIAVIPAESYGQDAATMAVTIRKIAAERGIPLGPSGLFIDIGPDSALGRLVKIEAHYARYFPFRRTHVKLEIRCDKALIPSRYSPP